MNMHVKKGDKVKVITGKNRGVETTVLKAIKATSRVVLEGVNVVKKHAKATSANQKGQIVEVAMSVHSSNVKKI